MNFWPIFCPLLTLFLGVIYEKPHHKPVETKTPKIRTTPVRGVS
jgi:hypothetical protein